MNGTHLMLAASIIIVIVVGVFSSTALAQSCPDGGVYVADFTIYSDGLDFNSPHYETNFPVTFETYEFVNPHAFETVEIIDGMDSEVVLFWSGVTRVTFPSTSGVPDNGGDIWFYLAHGNTQELDIDVYVYDGGNIVLDNSVSGTYFANIDDPHFFVLEIESDDPVAYVDIEGAGNELGIARTYAY